MYEFGNVDENDATGADEDGGGPLYAASTVVGLALIEPALGGLHRLGDALEAEQYLFTRIIHMKREGELACIAEVRTRIGNLRQCEVQMRENPAGEAKNDDIRLLFNRRLRLEFRGAKITSDAGLLAVRELDEMMELTDMAADLIVEGRVGKNIRHQIPVLLRQSV